MDAETAARALDALEGDRIGRMFALMLLTGLRPGEETGLCWDGVDLDGGHLFVWRVVRMIEGHAVLVDDTKTAKSTRGLDLPDRALDMLRRQRKEQLAERAAPHVR